MLNNELKQLNPNIKLVILFYWDGADSIIQLKQALENKNIILIHAFDLTDENLQTSKYKQSENNHPRAEAWNLLVPKISKKIEL